MTTPPTRNRPQIVLFRTLLLSHAQISDEIKQLLAERCGLTMLQFDMLAELGGQPPMRMSDLSAKMITSPSSVTRVAKSLEGKGFVQRQRAEQSEREVLAALTPDGDAFFRKHFVAVADKIRGLIDERLDESEQQQLTTLLAKLGRP